MDARIARARARLAEFARGKPALLELFALLRKLRRRVPQPPADFAILGTSNGIGPSSFVSKITDARPGTKVQNLSVGACSSAVGLYMLDLLRPGARDGLALLDYAINDSDAAYHLWGEANAADVIGRHLPNIVGHARGQGYLPILIVMPAELAMSESLPGERIHEEFCRRENLSCINLRVLLQLALSKGASLAALMRDSWHLSERANALFADFVLELRERVRLLPRTKSMRTISITPSRVVTAEQLFRRGSLVSRTSTLRSGWYGRLLPGEKLVVPVGEHERIAGVMINVGRPGGTIAIRGSNGEAIKSLTFAWSDHKPELFFSVLVDVAQSIAGGRQGIAIEIVSDDCTPTEPTIHGHPSPPVRDREIEIEGVLVTSLEKSDFTLSSTDYQGLPLELAELPEARRLLAALTALPSPAIETA